MRQETVAAIRSLIEEIRLVPENGQLEIEITGALETMFDLVIWN